MKNVIFVGPPGSGKGTQCENLKTNYGFIQISTGELLREETQSDSQDASEIKKIMASGSFVSDELINEILAKRLTFLQNKPISGVIFDGYPRNLSQAQNLEKLLLNLGQKIDHVIEISIEREVVIKRLKGRYICSNCKANYSKYYKKPKIEDVCDYCKGSNFTFREDDNENVINSRLDTYDKLTRPLIDYYTEKKILKQVDGSSYMDEVSKQICLILNI